MQSTELLWQRKFLMHHVHLAYPIRCRLVLFCHRGEDLDKSNWHRNSWDGDVSWCACKWNLKKQRITKNLGLPLNDEDEDDCSWFAWPMMLLCYHLDSPLNQQVRHMDLLLISVSDSVNNQTNLPLYFPKVPHIVLDWSTSGIFDGYFLMMQSPLSPYPFQKYIVAVGSCLYTEIFHFFFPWKTTIIEHSQRLLTMMRHLHKTVSWGSGKVHLMIKWNKASVVWLPILAYCTAFSGSCFYDWAVCLWNTEFRDVKWFFPCCCQASTA